MSKFAVGFVIGGAIGVAGGIYLSANGLALGFKKNPENIQKFFDIFAKFSDELNIDVMDMAKKAVDKKVREII